MGQTLAALAGNPVIDVTPPRQQQQRQQPERAHVPVEAVLCCVCHETPRRSYVCCTSGHSGCSRCMQKLRERSGLCPLCRQGMLETLIPNLALDAAVEAALQAPVLPESTPATPKRARPPQNPAARQQKAARVAQLANQLCDGL